MPVFPKNDQNVGFDVVRAPTIDINADAIGRSMTILGSGFDEFGAMASKLEARKSPEDAAHEGAYKSMIDSQDAFKADMDLRGFLGKSQADLEQARAGMTSADRAFTNNYVTNYYQSAESLIGKAPASVRSQLATGVLSGSDHLFPQAAIVQHDRQIADEVASLDSLAQGYVARLAQDPSSLDAMVADVRQMVAKAPSIPPEQKLAFDTRYTHDLTLTAWQKRYEGDPAGAAKSFYLPLSGEPGKNGPDAGAATGATRGSEAPAGTQRSAYQTRLVTRSGADMAGLDPSARSLLDSVVASGVVPELRVNSGHRDVAANQAAGGAKGSQHIAGKALDIDISGLSPVEKAAVLSAAIAGGARGVGIYPSGNSLHIDTRDTPAVWGLDKDPYHALPPQETLARLPDWARPAIGRLYGGGDPAAANAAPAGVMRSAVPAPGTDVPPGYGINPAYAPLYAKRASLVAGVEARAAQNQALNLGRLTPKLQTQIKGYTTIGSVEGEPLAFKDFQASYATPEQAQREWQTFEHVRRLGGQIDLVKAMTPQDQQAYLDARAPTGTGTDFAGQRDQHALLGEAVAVNRKARADDPHGYVTAVYPEIGKAWADAENDPQALPHAIAATSAAMEQLGIPPGRQRLLSKPAARNMADSFLDTTKPISDRFAPLRALTGGISDPWHHIKVFAELAEAGMPLKAQAVTMALARGEEAAAGRIAAAIDWGSHNAATSGDPPPRRNPDAVSSSGSERAGTSPETTPRVQPVTDSAPGANSTSPDSSGGDRPASWKVGPPITPNLPANQQPTGASEPSTQAPLDGAEQPHAGGDPALVEALTRASKLETRINLARPVIW
ncbi:hypothetical protein LMIY3S_05457 [Labrys miyagiensis]